MTVAFCYVQEDKAEKERAARERKVQAKAKVKGKARGEKERLAAERDDRLRAEQEAASVGAAQREADIEADKCVLCQIYDLRHSNSKMRCEIQEWHNFDEATYSRPSGLSEWCWSDISFSKKRNYQADHWVANENLPDLNATV